MSRPKVTPLHVFLLLTIFLGGWVWTEVQEYIDRENFGVEVYEFMNRGDRFTTEDGEVLKSRLEATQAAMMGINRRLIVLEDMAHHERVERVEHDGG